MFLMFVFDLDSLQFFQKFTAKERKIWCNLIKT